MGLAWRTWITSAPALLLSTALARADLPPVASVSGTDVTLVHVGPTLAAALASGSVAWRSLATTNVSPGPRWLVFPVPIGTKAVLVPVCAGRARVLLDDAPVMTAPGPVVVDVPRDGGEHRVAILVSVSGYEHRIACGDAPRLGTRAAARDGLLVMTFESTHAGPDAGAAVVYVPPRHDVRRPATLLVGLHPWNGGIWTYAAYDALLDAARAADVVLLLPSGLGNSLYTAEAEDEVLEALHALGESIVVDPDRVTLFGASMGGAGATTIGFHHPDRFAGIVSFFGDSRYDLTTYVHAILRDPAAAHAVNALDIVDNARNVPVWLVHGDDDQVSPPAQSVLLARALAARHFAVTFDRVPHAGHEGRIVSLLAGRIVDVAAHARRAVAPPRVSYWSVRRKDDEAYGIRWERSGAGDVFFDLERRADTLHLVEARGVRSLTIPRGAFGFSPTDTPPALCDDPAARAVAVTWDAAR